MLVTIVAVRWLKLCHQRCCVANTLSGIQDSRKPLKSPEQRVSKHGLFVKPSLGEIAQFTYMVLQRDNTIVGRVNVTSCHLGRIEGGGGSPFADWPYRGAHRYRMMKRHL